MRALRQMMILSTLLQAVAFAWAESPVSQSPIVPNSPNSPSHPSPRMHYFLNERFLNQWDKSPAENPKVDSNFRRESSAEVNNKAAPLDTKHPSGLNFVLTGPNPGLEYKFSETGSAHLHVGKHGTGATAVWNF